MTSASEHLTKVALPGYDSPGDPLNATPPKERRKVNL
jgi:hypothetical protein